MLVVLADTVAGGGSQVARRAHNPKVVQVRIRPALPGSFARTIQTEASSPGGFVSGRGRDTPFVARAGEVPRPEPPPYRTGQLLDCTLSVFLA